MLQKLQFTVCSLRQHGRAERLHDLLDSHGLASELVLGRTVYSVSPKAFICIHIHSVRTRQAQTHPFQLVVSRNICTGVSPAL